MVDLVHVRGFDEYVKVTVKLEISANNPNVYVSQIEKQYNTKLWNPLNWAFHL